MKDDKNKSGFTPADRTLLWATFLAALAADVSGLFLLIGTLLALWLHKVAVCDCAQSGNRCPSRTEDQWR